MNQKFRIATQTGYFSSNQMIYKKCMPLNLNCNRLPSKEQHSNIILICVTVSVTVSLQTSYTQGDTGLMGHAGLLILLSKYQ